MTTSKRSGVCWFGLPNATDLWQPVDADYAELLKKFVTQKLHDWLDSEDNADRWYNNTDPFSAKERRILIIHWAGQAYEKLTSPEYDKFRWRLWEKTGCLITVDGSDDNKIHPEGLPDYNVPEPCIFVEASAEALVPNEVEPDAMTEIANQDVEDDENPPEDEVLEDNVAERNDNPEYVGRKVKALYENGWWQDIIL